MAPKRRSRTAPTAAIPATIEAIFIPDLISCFPAAWSFLSFCSSFLTAFTISGISSNAKAATLRTGILIIERHISFAILLLPLIIYTLFCFKPFLIISMLSPGLISLVTVRFMALTIFCPIFVLNKDLSILSYTVSNFWVSSFFLSCLRGNSSRVS